jgi:hypothetical protein
MMPPPTNLFGGFQVKETKNITTPLQSKTSIDTTENKTLNETKQKNTNDNRLFSNLKFQIFGFNGNLLLIFLLHI